MTILEGESLINDGVALTAFGLAVEAMAHPFTFEHGVVRLVEVVLGGIAYGLVVALVIGRVRRYVRDPSVQILVTLITPFVAYVPAEELNVSGVLATVVTGVYLGTRTEGMLQAASRVSGTMFWRTLIFLLESALFVLLGLELRSVVDHLSRGYSVAWLAGAAAAVVAAVVVIRLAWELMVSPLIRFIPGRHSGYVRNPWRQRLVIGWGGMRGAISLAIALTLPLDAHGQPFTERPTLVFLAAVVVIVTLVGQGLTLGAAARRARPRPGRRAAAARGGGPPAGHRGRPGPARRARRERRRGRGHGERVPAAVRAAAGAGPGRARRRRASDGTRAAHQRPAPRAGPRAARQAGRAVPERKISDDIRRSIALTLDLQDGPRGGLPHA